MSTRSEGRRRGAALVAVVLLTLALFAVGHGMLALSLGELAASRAAVRLVGAQAAAEGATSESLAPRSAPAWLDSVAEGASRRRGTWSFGHAEGSSTLLRLTREAWWIEGVGRMGAAEARTGRLAWALDPLARVLWLGGAVSVGVGAPVAIDGLLDASDPGTAEPPLSPADCADWASALRAHYTSSPLTPVAVLDPADSLPRLGHLDFMELLSMAQAEVTGVGTPATAEAGGACLTTDPWNWGDPMRRWRPCGEHLPLTAAFGDLTVAGGNGQALLVVDGDVTLRSGARLFGLIVASGMIALESDAELDGMALASGGVHLAAGSQIRASACWAARALSLQRSTLGALRPVPGTGRIAPLG